MTGLAHEELPGSERVVRVLQSTQPPDGTTRFIDQVVSHASDETVFTYFTWRAALFGSYDVVHVHWPEALIRSKSVMVRMAKIALLRLLVLRSRLRRRPIVRTLHNLAPHDAESSESKALDYLDRNTTLFILLNRQPAPPRFEPTRVILHGHYQERFQEHARSEKLAKQLLYFGLIKPYKNVALLVATFVETGLSAQGYTLRIVGRADARDQSEIRNAARGSKHVSFVFDFVPDSQLVQEVTASQLVILPYRELYNSGVALVALSLGTPVLVPRSEASAELAAEVGDGWVLTFEDELTPRGLAEAAAGSYRAAPAPHLAGRDWTVVSAEYESAYRQALALVGNTVASTDRLEEPED